MKRLNCVCIGLLLLFGTMTGADEKSPGSVNPQLVRVDECLITLIDHVTLASDRSGILRSIEFKEGQPVTAGGQVALIDDRVAQANLAVAEKKAANDVEIKYHEVAYESAEKALRMMVESNENLSNQVPGKSKNESSEKVKRELKVSTSYQSVAQSEIDKTWLEAKKAQLSVEQAKHELALNKLNRDVTKAELDTYSVNAEFDGVIIKLFKKKGEAVRQGDPVAEIVNTDRVRIEGRVKLADLPYAKEGAKVRVRLFVEDLALPEEEEEFEGEITFVDLISSPIDQTTRVHAEVRNRNNVLRAGLKALMDIELDEATAAKRSRDLATLKFEKRNAAVTGR